MSSTSELLARKVGPLPAGAWLAVAAGGITAALFLNRRNAGAAVAVEGSDVGLDNTAPGAGNLSVGAAASNPTSTAPTSGGFAKPTTNEEWAQAVLIALIAKGYEATSVDDAVRAYLGGASLTLRERAIISVALTTVGGPPTPPPPPLIGNPAIPPPTLPKPGTYPGPGGTTRPTPYPLPSRVAIKHPAPKPLTIGHGTQNTGIVPPGTPNSTVPRFTRPGGVA